jgi:hypothetical protein
MDNLKTRDIPIEELKPCLLCGGKIVPAFYEVTIRHAVINAKAVNQMLGLTQYF